MREHNDSVKSCNSKKLQHDKSKKNFRKTDYQNSFK